MTPGLLERVPIKLISPRAERTTAARAPRTLGWGPSAQVSAQRSEVQRSAMTTPSWAAAGLVSFRHRHASRQSGSWRVLRAPNVRAYFIGSTVSNLGTWLQNTAQLLVAYQLTHSVFAVGVITSLQFSGFLTVGPWAGSVADKLGRKKVLVTSQLVSAAVASGLAGLEATGHLTKVDLGVGALIMGLAMTFALPVQTSMLSALVPERDKKAALAMNSISYNAGRTFAPVLCLVVLASFGVGWAFALNALTFVFFAATVVAVYPPEPTDRHQYVRPWAVLSIVIERPRIMLLLAMVAAVTFADDPILVLGPSLSHQIGIPNIWPAYFLSALGLGAVLGVLFPARQVPARRAVIPLGILAAAVILFSFGVSAWISVLAAVLAGAAGLMTGSAAQALLLREVDPQRAIQVMALWAVAWAGTKPIASFVDGWLASQVGLQWTAAILVIPAASVTVIELCLRPSLRRRLKRAIWTWDYRQRLLSSHS